MSYDIDITNTPPAHEPERQYYYMAKAKDFVEKKSKEIGRPMTYFVRQHIKILRRYVNEIAYTCCLHYNAVYIFFCKLSFYICIH